MDNVLAHYFHLRRTTGMCPADAWDFAQALDALDHELCL